MQLATITQTFPPASTPAAATTTPIERGQVLGGRYVIEKTIGRGGYGTVYRAWDHVLAEGVALKVLLPALALGQAGQRRLAREVRLARGLRHPNVCPVFGLERVDGHTFIAMELARGSLAHELADPEVRAARGPGARWDARLEDAAAICRGLAAIHAAGIAHRDLKADNVLRMRDGRLAIADFGVALLGDDGTAVGGTPSGYPPEAVFGLPTDRRSDVWQLGLLLHELLWGARPRWKLRSGEVPAPSRPARRFSPGAARLATSVAACLSVYPDDRPTSAEIAEIAEAAARAQRGRGAGPPGRRRGRRAPA